VTLFSIFEREKKRIKVLPFKKILWPTDFSEPSYDALKTAHELALLFSSELYIVHVITPLPPLVEIPHDRPNFDVPSYLDELQLSAKKSIQEVIDKKIEKNLAVHASVVHGDASVEVTRIAERENIDLIVIAAHGTTGSRRFFFGAVAEKIARIASCSVLIIRSPSGGE
jgi:nucleotide-binding universal stress UspA family protein